MPTFSLALLLPIALIFFLLSLAVYYAWALMPRSGTVEWIYLIERPPFAFLGGRNPLDRLDILVVALLVLVWGGITFFHLGDREAPQTFHEFREEYVVIDLGETVDVGRVRYYTGLFTGEYALYFSQDGEAWHRQGEMPQNFARLFQWLEAEIVDGTAVRYVRLGAMRGGPLQLGELAIYNAMGRRLEPGRFSLEWSNPALQSGALFDEQDTVPDRGTFMNSMYFDEIYHARTAYEHVMNEAPTELSHPPLGKVLMGIGIYIFGMTPFGWRFMGAFLGIMILALFYCMTKQMFGKRLVAVCATAVFAASFMHYTQTRIATIDTYVVLFVLLQFWFIYRYVSQDLETPFAKTLPSLFFAGLFFGFGAASKWSSLYLAPALALLWLIYQILRAKHFKQIGQKGFRTYLIQTILVSCVFFLLIPGIIYYLSYIPHGREAGYGIFDVGYWNLVIANQRHMWWFHNAVAGMEHGFSSYWWMWIFNIRPILYYASTAPDGDILRIAAFGNPAVYWGGLLAMIAMPVAWIRRGDGRAFAIFLCYIMLLLPWMFIPRTSFAYHYFVNIIFLCLALAYVFDHLIRRGRGRYKTAIVGFTLVSVGLFALFYPALSGWPMSSWYSQNVLRWFETWPIW
ncbi:MAG: glycosyltransferase family 39 protein [Oscillospiraceae bacterium]|nr:glycosyltransferase family 39 protein [Oscillospiraceae bacterium]